MANGQDSAEIAAGVGSFCDAMFVLFTKMIAHGWTHVESGVPGVGHAVAPAASLITSGAAYATEEAGAPFRGAHLTLQHPTLPLQVCFQKGFQGAGVITHNGAVKFSRAVGFTGGSDVQMPTAADELYIYGAGPTVAPGWTALIDAAGVGGTEIDYTYDLNVTIATGEYWLRALSLAVGDPDMPIGGFSFFLLDGCDPTDNDPYEFRTCNSVTYPLCDSWLYTDFNDGSPVNYNSEADPTGLAVQQGGTYTWLRGGLSGAAPVKVAGQYGIAIGGIDGEQPVTQTRGAVNAFTGFLDLYPMALVRGAPPASNNVQDGYKGWTRSYLVVTRAGGVTTRDNVSRGPLGTERDGIVMRGYVLPWDGTPTGANFRATRRAPSGGSPPAPPFISNVSPAVNTPIAGMQVLSFRLNVVPANLRTVVLIAKFEGFEFWETVWDGAGFSPPYAKSSSVVTVPNVGFDFAVLRTGGWPDSPGILPVAVDTSGQENS